MVENILCLWPQGPHSLGKYSYPTPVRLTSMTKVKVPSASEVTTLWRYTNLLIIIIIIVLTTLYTNEECQRRGNWVWTTCPESLRNRARPGIELATSWSQVRRPTIAPRRHPQPAWRHALRLLYDCPFLWVRFNWWIRLVGGVAQW